MRKIKFRGKRPNSGKWIIGYLYQELNLISWILSDKFKSPDCSCEVLTETAGQFIGLTDKNSVEIFENDIIRKHNHRNGEKIEDYIVVFDYGSFCLKTVKDNEIHDKGTLISFGNFTENGNLRKEYVIGNIFDNPELL